MIQLMEQTKVEIPQQILDTAALPPKQNEGNFAIFPTATKVGI